jgi:hypothetical protein
MYSSTCFGRPHAHPQELKNCGSSANCRGRAGYLSNHDQQHCYHHAPTVKPEAATAVVELLMMGVRTPETCWAVHKTSRNNTLEIAASCSMIYLNYVVKSLNFCVFIINLGVLFTFWHRKFLTSLCALMCVKTSHYCCSTALSKWQNAFGALQGLGLIGRSEGGRFVWSCDGDNRPLSLEII